jgi:GT2 family glycosyltransferase
VLSSPTMAAMLVFAAVTSLLFYRARKHYRALPLLPPVAPGITPPDCMVVIPARNEEGLVAGAVQCFPPDTVIVVDDHSTDLTSAEAESVGAGVLPAPHLSKGASGKASACMAGARILTSRWILFADADTRYEAGFLDSVVQYAETSGLALLSVALTAQPRSLAGHLVEPYTAALFFSAANIKKPAEVFRGQCILVRRDAYEFLGGHAAVWKYLAEDVELARLAERHRTRFALVRAGSMGYAHGHAGWKDSWNNIERDAFRSFQINPWTSLIILIAALCAALWLPLAAWLWIGGHRVAPAVLVFLIVLQLSPWYRPWPRAILAPLAIYSALPPLLLGWISALANRPIQWKGRPVKAI